MHLLYVTCNNARKCRRAWLTIIKPSCNDPFWDAAIPLLEAKFWRHVMNAVFGFWQVGLFYMSIKALIVGNQMPTKTITKWSLASKIWLYGLLLPFFLQLWVGCLCNLPFAAKFVSWRTSWFLDWFSRRIYGWSPANDYNSGRRRMWRTKFPQIRTEANDWTRLYLHKFSDT